MHCCCLAGAVVQNWHVLAGVLGYPTPSDASYKSRTGAPCLGDAAADTALLRMG
jgi:hypothetical protein